MAEMQEERKEQEERNTFSSNYTYYSFITAPHKPTETVGHIN
jgi:hypothetical protein